MSYIVFGWTKTFFMANCTSEVIEYKGIQFTLSKLPVSHNLRYANLKKEYVHRYNIKFSNKQVNHSLRYLATLKYNVHHTFSWSH